MKLSVASAAAAISVASAHTIFVQLESNGVTNAVSYGIRTPSYDGPITDVSSNDLACNGGPNPTTPSNKIIDVKAGSTVRYPDPPKTVITCSTHLLLRLMRYGDIHSHQARTT